MRWVLGFLRFWYDFFVGDDPTVAAAVVVALIVTALLSSLHVAWPVLPLAVLAVLGVSVRRASRSSGNG